MYVQPNAHRVLLGFVQHSVFTPNELMVISMFLKAATAIGRVVVLTAFSHRVGSTLSSALYGQHLQ